MLATTPPGLNICPNSTSRMGRTSNNTRIKCTRTNRPIFRDLLSIVNFLGRSLWFPPRRLEIVKSDNGDAEEDLKDDAVLLLLLLLLLLMIALNARSIALFLLAI